MTHYPTLDPRNDPMYGQHASREARYLFAYLHRRGGTMRLAPMLRHLRMEPRDFLAAVAELASDTGSRPSGARPRLALPRTSRVPTPRSSAWSPPASAARSTARHDRSIDVARRPLSPFSRGQA